MQAASADRRPFNIYAAYYQHTFQVLRQTPDRFHYLHLRELMKLPHVRQLQESSLALSRERPAGGRLEAAAYFCLYIQCFVTLRL